MEYYYLIIMVCLTVAGQLLIKVASSKVTLKRSELNFKTLSNPWLVSGVAITFAAPVFYFLALKKIDLSIAFAFSSLNYALVMIASSVFFKEKLSFNKVIGTLIIVAGILLFSI
jgi:drug/metabolite transporter (DMT)-like permease